MCPEIDWPSPANEAADPEKTDAIYASALNALRECRRSEGYRLLLAENAAYGFRRNMYGAKVAAMMVALIAGAYAAGSLIAQVQGASWPQATIDRVLAEPVYALLVLADASIVISWARFVRAAWVRDAGISYARALLGTLDAEASGMATPVAGVALGPGRR